MKLIIDCKINYSSDSISDDLILKLSFKQPDKLFKTRYKIYLCSTWGNVSYENFLNECIQWLSSKDKLINFIKEEVMKRLNEVTDKEKLEKELSLLLNNYKKKFKVELDLDE